MLHCKIVVSFQKVVSERESFQKDVSEMNIVVQKVLTVQIRPFVTHISNTFNIRPFVIDDFL